MPAPCGCGGQAIQIEGTFPICVERSGVRPVTYTVSLCDGEGGCNALIEMLARNLGPGLVVDEGSCQLQVALSDDEGNTLTFGTDGGVMNAGGPVPPQPPPCMQTIADLPTAPDVLGAKSLAGLHNPYSSPYGVDYCLANKMDIIHFQVGTCSDDVGVVSDFWDHVISAGRSSIYITQDIRQLPCSAVQSCYNYAGDVDDPVTYNPGPDVGHVNKDERRGGWWGWLAQRYYQPLAEDFLRKIDGKSVALLACTPQPGSFGFESTHIRGAMRAVEQQCAQLWSMIGVGEIANATTILNRDMTPILNPDGPEPPELWGTTDLPYPVADVTAAGIEWIMLSDFYADSVFQAYQAAGINVLMIGNSRQSQYTRITDLGIRGYLGLDPVYFADFRRPLGSGDKYGYRSASDPWQHRRPSLGQLTHRTDAQSVRSEGGFVRGRPDASSQGLILPAGFGSNLDRPSVLVWDSPVTDDESYTISWDARWNTLATNSATNALMGSLFAAATDDGTLAWPDDPDANPRGFPEGQQMLYRAFQRQNGQIGLAKWSTPTGTIEYLATMDTPAIAADVYNSYSVEVTPAQITFTRTLTDGTQFTVTTADAQHRGAYYFIEKRETFFESSIDSNPFEGQFRNVAYSTVPDAAAAAFDAFMVRGARDGGA